MYGLFFQDKQIGFNCFANYTPHRKGTRKILHANRAVIHPDYQGLGLGIKLLNESAKHFMSEHGKTFRIMTKFSAVPVYKSMIKQKEWRYLGAQRMMGKMQKGGGMERNRGFREGGIKTYHFEWIG